MNTPNSIESLRQDKFLAGRDRGVFQYFIRISFRIKTINSMIIRLSYQEVKEWFIDSY